MHPSIAADAEFAARFADEVRLASRVRHPNVVATLDAVDACGELLLVIEYVDGAPLAALMAAVKQPGAGVPSRVAGTILADVAHGLHAVHEAKSTDGTYTYVDGVRIYDAELARRLEAERRALRRDRLRRDRRKPRRECAVRARQRGVHRCDQRPQRGFEEANSHEPLPAALVRELRERNWPGNVRGLRDVIEPSVSLGLNVATPPAGPTAERAGINRRFLQRTMTRLGLRPDATDPSDDDEGGGRSMKHVRPGRSQRRRDRRV